jgi:hypothetical protein
MTEIDVGTGDRSWLERWSPFAGLLFVAGWIFTFISLGDDSGDTAAELVRYAEDRQGRLIAAQIVVLLFVVVLSWFVAGLAARVRRIAGATETMVVAIAGAAFAVLNVVALTVWFAPLLDLESDSARAAIQAEAYLMFDDFGWVLLGASGVAAGVMAITASLAALRSASVPTWLGALGILAGVVSLATVAFVGIFAWLAWILVASIVLLMRRA